LRIAGKVWLAARQTDARSARRTAKAEIEKWWPINKAANSPVLAPNSGYQRRRDDIDRAESEEPVAFATNVPSGSRNRVSFERRYIVDAIEA